MAMFFFLELGADDEHGYSSAAGLGRRQGKGEEGTVAPEAKDREGRCGRSSGKEC